MHKLLSVAVALLLVLAMSCSSSGTGSGNGVIVDTDDYTVAEKLAVLNGDIGDAPAFQAVIDCITASGIEGAETEERVGDTLYASWEASAQRETLLEWGQALCSG